MSNLTIIYDNYKFEIELFGTHLNVKLTDIEQLDIYECSVKEADIYVKPIKKFYSMIEKGLSREPNYNVTINDKKTPLVCSFAYSTEMVDIEESVSFTKVNTQKTKELLLIERVKELTELATPVFGYRNFGERMTFNIDSKVLDFRPFDDYTMYPHIKLLDYDKFRKAKKIILSTDSKVFCGTCNRPIEKMQYNCGCPANRTLAFVEFVTFNVGDVATTTSKYTSKLNCGSHPNHFDVSSNFTPTNHFNHPSVFLPSVTEIEVFCSPYENLEREFSKFGSLPNLEKLSLVQRDNTDFRGPFIDIHSLISTSPNKKLKHIILKNMSTWIKPDTVDKAKLFAQVNHIRLEII